MRSFPIAKPVGHHDLRSCGGIEPKTSRGFRSLAASRRGGGSTLPHSLLRPYLSSSSPPDESSVSLSLSSAVPAS